MAQDREGVDPFESMREQMDRERDNFFRGVNPRDWPNEGAAGSRGGIFNRVSSIRKYLIIVGLPRHPHLYWKVPLAMAGKSLATRSFASDGPRQTRVGGPCKE